uniref:Uncharacterized protein n=1 Tax=Anguilla anguilla TaxID=7936 RepID=A0A0E9QA23_ANGAN
MDMVLTTSAPLDRLNLNPVSIMYSQ